MYVMGKTDPVTQEIVWEKIYESAPKNQREFKGKSSMLDIEVLLMTTLGERLKRLREQKNLPQRSVAEFLGMNVRTLQYYESNKLEPKMDTLSKLANYFNVPLDYFFGIMDNEFRLKLTYPEETVIKKLRSLDGDDMEIVESVIDGLYKKTLKNKPK